MAISFVGLGAAATSSVSLPAFLAGDLGLVHAFLDGSTTPPDLPAGWTDIVHEGSNTCSQRVGYRVLQTGDTDTSTWTNATEIQVMVLRGTSATQPVDLLSGSGVDTTNNSNLIDYPTLDRGTTLVSSVNWLVGMAAHRAATNVNVGTVTGWTLRSGSIGTLGAHTKTGVSTFGGVVWDGVVNSSTGAWRSVIVEIVDASITFVSEAWFSV